jgi:hypothetical protein
MGNHQKEIPAIGEKMDALKDYQHVKKDLQLHSL